MSKEIEESMLATLTREQCRGARAMLEMSRADLAQRSEVALRTIVDFESGARTPYKRTLACLRRALEDAGAVFIAAEDDLGPGVRLRNKP